jgi:hypothetical protein
MEAVPAEELSWKSVTPPPFDVELDALLIIIAFAAVEESKNSVEPAPPMPALLLILAVPALLELKKCVLPKELLLEAVAALLLIVAPPAVEPPLKRVALFSACEAAPPLFEMVAFPAVDAPLKATNPLTPRDCPVA